MKELGAFYQHEQLRIRPESDMQSVWNYLVRYYDRYTDEIIITGSMEDLLKNPDLLRMLLSSCNFSISQSNGTDFEVVNVHSRVANTSDNS